MCLPGSDHLCPPSRFLAHVSGLSAKPQSCHLAVSLHGLSHLGACRPQRVRAALWRRLLTASVLLKGTGVLGGRSSQAGEVARAPLQGGTGRPEGCGRFWQMSKGQAMGSEEECGLGPHLPAVWTPALLDHGRFVAYVLAQVSAVETGCPNVHSAALYAPGLSQLSSYSSGGHGRDRG